jgi:hypothetical protein
MTSSGMCRRVDRVCTDVQPPGRAGGARGGFSTLKMEAILLPKCRFTQDLHGATSQNTEFFIVTAVKT